LLSHVEDTSAITIAPSPDGGTNALLLHPPDAIPFHFGRNSFAHHSASASEAGFTIRSVTSQGLQTDIDMPQDLLQLPPRLLAQLPHSASSAQPWR
jgi:2-phospho-L-lactate guanylyltransferase (CobY/MobA/RfbA family)